MNNWTLMNYGELKKQIEKAVSELGTVLDLKGIVETTSASGYPVLLSYRGR